MSKQLGIIGGGQLGLYLCQAAQGLGIEVSVFTDTADDAALRFADKGIVGALADNISLEHFLGSCDVVTFDKEAIPEPTLARLLEAQAQGRVEVHPGAETLLTLKDKALQKTWLQRHDLPTLPFHILAGRESAREPAVATLGRALVQKARRGGYDGRGVQIVHDFRSERQLWDLPSILEPFLSDCSEIAVLTARDKAGNIQTYPPVSMEFDPELNSVKTVAMPAAISPQLGAAAVALAERVVTLLEGVGVFAIEMFVTPEQELLINEISPRVHNSGHVTLEACNVSQFEQHVRAVMGLPLASVEAVYPAVMLNILYTETIRQHCPAAPTRDPATHPGAALYWYGKAPGRPGRKMGHINARGACIEAAAALAGGALAQLHADNSEQAA